MKNAKPMASPELTEKLLHDVRLIREYVEYLRAKLEKDEGGYYFCASTDDDPNRCWDQTERFCRKKGLDFDTVFSAFSLDFGCEAKVATYFDLRAFRKEGKRQRGRRKKVVSRRLSFQDI